MRQLTVTDASRAAAKARIALSGGPGWGKTWTALSIARVLSPAGIVMVIDTEHESASLYAPPPGRRPGPGEFEFKHAAWVPPYDPRELTDAIYHYAGHVDVLIVDSLSHFWQGEGGTLDISSGRFTGWKDARPIQRKLVDAIVRAPCHVIGCMRSKVAYTQSQDANGKQVVSRLGQADIQDAEMPYEFTLAAELDAQHQLTITKTRCRDLALGRVYPPNREVDMAATLLAWLNAGGQPAQTSPGPDAPASASGKDAGSGSNSTPAPSPGPGGTTPAGAVHPEDRPDSAPAGPAATLADLEVITAARGQGLNALANAVRKAARAGGQDLPSRLASFTRLDKLSPADLGLIAAWAQPQQEQQREPDDGLIASLATDHPNGDHTHVDPETGEVIDGSEAGA